MISQIVNARLLDRDGLWRIELRDGRIRGIEPSSSQSIGEARDTLDAGGRLVTPSLVDPHLHLDLAYSLELVPENKSGTLLEAIELWSRAKAELSAKNVRERAVRAIREEVRHGTGLIRTHVDVASNAGMRLCEGVLAAREATQSLCEIQVVAFPQDGLIRDPQAVEQMRDAIKAGVDVVGGIPHIERTQRDGLEHLEVVFDIAAQFDADIDVHIDETDDASSVYTESLAALAIERGWQGRVTASHVCALSSYSDVHASRVMDLIAEAGVSVVTNPGVNLHLQGRFDRYPKRRGLTRVRELLDRGVVCGAGQDCIRDPFYPLGNGAMLDQAFLLVHADHLSLPRQVRQAFDMVCGSAGRIVRQQPYEIAVGASDDLVVWPQSDAAELVRLRPIPTAVFRNGRLVAREGAVTMETD